MRKFFTICIILSLFFTSMFMTNTHSTNNPTSLVGETFVYNVIASELNVTLKNQDYFVDSYQYEYQQFPAHTDISMEVTSVDDEDINYTQTVGETSFNTSYPYYPEFYEIFFVGILSHYFGLSYYIASGISYDYNEFGNFSGSFFASGLAIYLSFFLPLNDTVWESIEDATIFYNNASNYSNNNFYHDLSALQFTYNEIEGFIYIEGWYSGHLYARDAGDGDICTNLLLIYEKATGVLYGFHSKGCYDGKLFKNKIRVDYDLHVELADYDMPVLSLFTPLKVPNSVIIVPIGLVVCTIVYNKKKERN
ncbi:MAG: choice-of-anchor S family protein [Candidatus Thorarchaeota archaeon]